jgi:nucleotide-binding universal stress UspA family protein
VIISSIDILREGGVVKRIVVGVDGSAPSGHALEWAIQWARETGSEIIAVNALSHSAEFVLSVPPFDLQVALDDMKGALEKWCAPLRKSGVPHRSLILEEDPVHGLRRVAEQEDADLIVVGSHGHGTFLPRLLGSVTYKLAHNGRIPLVIVPQPLESAA